MKTADKDACAENCCSNLKCHAWTWRKEDSDCTLKKNIDLQFNPTDTSSVHYSSKKIGGKRLISWLYIQNLYGLFQIPNTLSLVAYQSCVSL